MSRPQKKTPNGRGSEQVLDRPRAEKLRGKSVGEVRDEFDVTHTTATKWLCEIGEYEPNREHIGTTSDLCARLSEMDPDEFPPEEGSA